MSAQLLSNSLEVGIVTRNIDAMVHFYRDVLGLPFKEELVFPGGTMQRFSVGDNVVKLVVFDEPPAHDAVGGGQAAATGYRYFSLVVANLEQVTESVAAAGFEVPVAPTAFGGGIGWAFVADPDGNWIELFGPFGD